MLKIQSTVYPAGRAENKIKDGGLWHSDHQNQLLELSKQIIQVKPVKTPREKLLKKLIIIALILDVLALIQIIS